jgi:hypothetical protein
MQRHLIHFGLACILPIAFLLWSLRPGCSFNFIPFAIHESAFRNVISESTFIRTFNTAIAVLLLALCMQMVRGAVKKA